MKILVIGSGGREHAVAWKLKQSSSTEIVFVAPGNAGTASEEGVENVDIAADDIQGLCDFAKQNNIDLTVVGPEVPLVMGVTDLFESNGFAVLGLIKPLLNWKVPKISLKNF